MMQFLQGGQKDSRRTKLHSNAKCWIQRPCGNHPDCARAIVHAGNTPPRRVVHYHDSEPSVRKADANDSESQVPNRHRQNVWGVAIGRRNGLHLESKSAGPKIAAIFSIVESCRKLSVPIRQYLADVLPGFARHSIEDLASLTATASVTNLAK